MDTVAQIAKAYLSSDFLIGVRINTNMRTNFDNMADPSEVDH